MMRYQNFGRDAGTSADDVALEPEEFEELRLIGAEGFYRETAARADISDVTVRLIDFGYVALDVEGWPQITETGNLKLSQSEYRLETIGLHVPRAMSGMRGALR